MGQSSAFRTAAPGVAALLLSASVHAHSEQGAAMGWVSGFLHPLSGADHVLAMIALTTFGNAFAVREPLTLSERRA